MPYVFDNAQIEQAAYDINSMGGLPAMRAAELVRLTDSALFAYYSLMSSAYTRVNYPTSRTAERRVPAERVNYNNAGGDARLTAIAAEIARRGLTSEWDRYASAHTVSFWSAVGAPLLRAGLTLAAVYAGGVAIQAAGAAAGVAGNTAGVSGAAGSLTTGGGASAVAAAAAPATGAGTAVAAASAPATTVAVPSAAGGLVSGAGAITADAVSSVVTAKVAQATAPKATAPKATAPGIAQTAPTDYVPLFFLVGIAAAFFL